MTIDYSQLKPAPPRDEPYHIVVTAAHHDDIEFGVAGSVARWIRDENASVTYIIITDGGSGSNDPDITRPQLVKLRRQEQIAAAAEVGVTDVRFLDYPDGALQATLDLRRDITRIIRETKAYRVVLQDPTHRLRARPLHQPSRPSRRRRSHALRRLSVRRNAPHLSRAAGGRLRGRTKLASFTCA